MKAIRVIALLSVLALLVMTAGGASSQGSGPLEPNALTGAVAAAISYQGRLVHPATGMPLSGAYDLEFTFWSLSDGGGQIGATISRNAQTITNGLYSTLLEVDPANINGQELWLQIRVRATGGTWETLTPRVQVLPTAYALSLRPGAQIQGIPTAWTEGWVLDVSMDGAYPLASAVRASTATGTALYGNSTGGYGLYGYSENGYAMYGVDAGSTQARGYGGYFTSTNGVGVFGYSDAQSHYTNMYAPGVYGASTYGAGVYGLGTGTTWPAYGGVFEGRSGVSAHSTGTSTQDGYAGVFVSQNFRGIYAASQAGYYDAYFGGTGGIYAANYWALYADRTLVVNGGDEVLEPGDVVAISNVATPLMDGGAPVLAVRKASGTTDIAIVGVVAQAVRVQEKEQPNDPSGPKQIDIQPVEGNIPPGGYLAMISHGLAPAVKVMTPAEELRVGDLLIPSTVPGRAEAPRADGQPVYTAGTILGKVAGPFDPKTGTVPVFVTLQ
jgi:hypothetical protein